MNTFLNPTSIRKKILCVFVFSSVCLLQAQKSQPLDSIQPKHEVRLDIFQLIVLPGIDVSYENYIDELSSWGVTAFLNLDSFYLEGYRFERFEIHAGVGRYFAFDEGNAYQEGTAYPRINFSIGKRF
jgi:hypothetical protein